MARYMMATKATHLLGDLSRKEPDLCVIHSEDAENFIGNWVTGFGFVEVKFPKSTTRELTEEEKEKWHGTRLSINDGAPFMTIRTKQVECVMTKESPLITLPNDELLKGLLRCKIEKYKSEKSPFHAPELEMDAICKIVVLERLLKDGKVSTWDLSRELGATYGSGFNTDSYDEACDLAASLCAANG